MNVCGLVRSWQFSLYDLGMDLSRFTGAIEKKIW